MNIGNIQGCVCVLDSPVSYIRSSFVIMIHQVLPQKTVEKKKEGLPMTFIGQTCLCTAQRIYDLSTLFRSTRFFKYTFFLKTMLVVAQGHPIASKSNNKMTKRCWLYPHLVSIVKLSQLLIYLPVSLTGDCCSIKH